MNNEMTSGLKITFLLHSLISGLVGFQHLFFPRIWTGLAGMEITETVTWRLIGAALLAFSVSSWMAFKEDNLNRVRIIILMEMVWSFLGAGIILWGISAEGLPEMEWVNVILLLLFGILFTLYYVRSRKSAGS
ncbi:MAG: hypothetical protein WAN36_10600 [Calditrichia bacterium]